MGRGLPFTRSLARLVRGGVASRPPWLSAVEAVPPHFAPVEKIVPTRIVFPEDRLREKFLRRNPDARRAPINLKARFRSEAHVADRFAAIQLRAMRERGLDEDDAYKYAQDAISGDVKRAFELAADIDTRVLNAADSDDTAKLYLASLKESQGDQTLHEMLLTEQRGVARSTKPRSEPEQDT
jgi:hypothetical protein